MSLDRSSVNKVPLGADLVIPALALCFAVYFFYSIADLAWEAKANGVLIGALLLALIGIQGVRVGVGVARKTGDLSFGSLLQPREVLPKRVGMVLLTVVLDRYGSGRS